MPDASYSPPPLRMQCTDCQQLITVTAVTLVGPPPFFRSVTTIDTHEVRDHLLLHERSSP